MPVQKLKQDPELQALLESVSKKYRPILLQMLTSLKNKSPAFARHAHVLFSRHVRLGVLRDSSQMTYIAIPEKKFLIHEGFLNEVSDDQVRQSLESLLLNQFATAAHTFNFNASKLDRMIKVGDVFLDETRRVQRGEAPNKALLQALMPAFEVYNPEDRFVAIGITWLEESVRIPNIGVVSKRELVNWWQNCVGSYVNSGKVCPTFDVSSKLIDRRFDLRMVLTNPAQAVAKKTAATCSMPNGLKDLLKEGFDRLSGLDERPALIKTWSDLTSSEQHTLASIYYVADCITKAVRGDDKCMQGFMACLKSVTQNHCLEAFSVCTDGQNAMRYAGQDTVINALQVIGIFAQAGDMFNVNLKQVTSLCYDVSPLVQPPKASPDLSSMATPFDAVLENETRSRQAKKVRANATTSTESATNDVSPQTGAVSPLENPPVNVLAEIKTSFSLGYWQSVVRHLLNQTDLRGWQKSAFQHAATIALLSMIGGYGVTESVLAGAMTSLADMALCFLKIDSLRVGDIQIKVADFLPVAAQVMLNPAQMTSLASSIVGNAAGMFAHSAREAMINVIACSRSTQGMK